LLLRVLALNMSGPQSSAVLRMARLSHLPCPPPCTAAAARGDAQQLLLLRAALALNMCGPQSSAWLADFGPPFALAAPPPRDAR